MREAVSVAMATYNGEKYIKEQLDSILVNLQPQDEVIISDDGSRDNTKSLIESYHDQRIHLIEGPHLGVKQNVGNALSHTSHEIIFLADQDDIWMKDKIDIVLETMKKEQATCVVHDALIVDQNCHSLGKTFFEYKNGGVGIRKNIIRNTYIGCCMAFNRAVLKKALPIPDSIEMHDQWIGLLNEKYGHSFFLKEPLIMYRRHGDNASKMTHYGICKMIRNRIVFIWNFFWRTRRKC